MSDKIYEFRKVEDFLQLTEEQFNRFLPDFIHWFAIRKTFIQKKQVAIEELGVFVRVIRNRLLSGRMMEKLGLMVTK